MKKTFALLSLILFVSSCAITSNQVRVGLVSNFKDRAELANVDNSVAAVKKGSACVESIFGLYTSGDSSIEKAKQNGKITKITNVDSEFSGFGFLYQKGCTVVYGN